MELSELCAVWSCLHDGHVVATSISGGRVAFEVRCSYIAEASGHPGRVFRVTVSEPVGWEPWERREGEREPPRLEDIAAHQADVLSAEEVGSQVAVTLLFEGWTPGAPPRQSGGRLLLRAEGAALDWADGEPLPTAELIAASARYWDAFGSSEEARVLSREEAVELLARHHVEEMDDDDRQNALHEVSQESWEDEPGWSDLDPTVIAEIRGETLPEPPSSERYRAALMLPARRRLRGAVGAWLADQLGERGHDVGAVEGAPAALHPCPCCGRRTLDRLGAWDICVVCWWEDDTSDEHAARSSGANAGVSLSAARANVLRYGLFDPARSDLGRLADAPEKYAVGRVFAFDDDGHVVELPASAAG